MNGARFESGRWVIHTMTKTKTNLDPWEKQEHETSKAYAAFCAYRDMGTDRSLAKQAASVNSELRGDSLAAKVRQLTKWSSKYGWVVRVEAYDVYLESKERHENELEIKKMAKRHAQVSLLTMKKAVDRIKLIGEKDIEELTPKEALEYLKVAAELERKSRGAPDQLVEHGGNIGVSRIEITTSKREDEEDESKV